MPANVKWQNVDFIKSDAFDWLERQFANVMHSTKESLEALRVLGENGTLTLPKKYKQLLDVNETIATGDGSTKTFYFVLKYKPAKKSNVTLTYTVGSTVYNTTDDGNGAFTQTGVLSGTINYDTGWITLTFTTAPDNNTPITVDYLVDFQTAWETMKTDLAEVYVAVRQLVSNGDTLSDPITNE